jgi:hypothetical protein
MSYGGSPNRWLGAFALLAMALEAPAHADAQIGGLADMAFGTISATTDQSKSENVCAFSTTGGFFGGAGYSIRATGNGTGGAFTLASGAAKLPYEVQWADSPNLTSGVSLTAGSLKSGFGNSAFLQNCVFQNEGTASHTIILRGTQLAAATAGSYTGTLQITIVPD